MDTNLRKKRILSSAALFLAAIIWGSSFFIVKNTVDIFPPHILLGIRFTLGAVLLSLLFFKHWKGVNRSTVFSGMAMGFFLFMGYSLQTIGITDTTPGKNAFLTAIYCVIVPFLFWAVNKTKPDRFHMIAAFLCIAGIGLVCLTEGLTIGFGDLLTLVCGFFYAAHIVVTAKVTGGKDPILLTIIQFSTAALLSWIVALFTEDIPAYVPIDAWGGVLYLAVFATAVALLLQVVGQKYTHPATASIILSLEAVFGVVFSVFFYGEDLTVQLIAGFALIFVAVIISETKLSFLFNKE